MQAIDRRARRSAVARSRWEAANRVRGAIHGTGYAFYAAPDFVIAP